MDVMQIVLLPSACPQDEDTSTDETLCAPVQRNALKRPAQPEASPAQSWKPPPSTWLPRCHRLVDHVSTDVEDYFLQNWRFPDANAELKFLKAGFSRVTCFYFPLAKDSRIHLACRLLTVLFLIDGELIIHSRLSLLNKLVEADAVG